MAGKELWYITEAHAKGQLSGDGEFTSRCHHWLEARTGTRRALLTHSCTASLEMAAILSGLEEGDEVIMPSYTFVSTANAFVLRGAVPVFVDIRPDTMNLDESKIPEAITGRTKVIVPMHYAGVSCEMDAIMDIARRHELVVIEDTAQGIMSSYKGQPLGSIGDIGTLSFHETKNIISGEGGAILINRHELTKRAEIIRDKGTDRKAFFRGEVDKYSWVDIGSSFLPSELVAAYLWAQIEEADAITQRRLMLWENYHRELKPLEDQGVLRRPVVPSDCDHNAHMYYILLRDQNTRNGLIDYLRECGIHTVFHYVPLHSSEKGKAVGRVSGELTKTDELSGRLLRLPFWLGVEVHQEEIVKEISRYLVG